MARIIVPTWPLLAGTNVVNHMCGGLGIRSLRTQNDAFLIRMGYNLLTRHEAFWVQVLHSRDNICWSLADGRKARFWSDPWIPGTKPLIDSLLPNVRIDTHAAVRVFVSNNDTVGEDRPTWCWDNTGLLRNHGVITPCRSTHRCTQQWRPPPHGVLKVNSDGAVNPESMVAAGGGVIRDSAIRCKVGYVRNIGWCSALHAEFWAN
ncbi:Detected protein of unknown function [Hibiscus syriacus]|uniref:RNase H type-1 domain-containing protein n=1 Tax=Hibiscus syriacus TaxID=106335 RepID=A0A6A2YQ62_HIBSY|nr:Detected protein of unknown function [Hibiscus syriacus]